MRTTVESSSRPLPGPRIDTAAMSSPASMRRATAGARPPEEGRRRSGSDNDPRPPPARSPRATPHGGVPGRGSSRLPRTRRQRTQASPPPESSTHRPRVRASCEPPRRGSAASFARLRHDLAADTCLLHQEAWWRRRGTFRASGWGRTRTWRLVVVGRGARTEHGGADGNHEQDQPNRARDRSHDRGLPRPVRETGDGDEGGVVVEKLRATGGWNVSTSIRVLRSLGSADRVLAGE